MSLTRIIEAAIEQNGKMTQEEICAALNLHRNSVSGTLIRLRKAERIHIGGWDRDDEHSRVYLRAVYVPGAGRDAPKPPAFTSAERQKQTRHRHRAITLARREYQRAGKANPFLQLMRA